MATDASNKGANKEAGSPYFWGQVKTKTKKTHSCLNNVFRFCQHLTLEVGM